MPIPQDILDQLFNTGGSAVQPPRRGDEIFVGTDQPRTWDEVVGQKRAIEQLRIAVLSARRRSERVPHTLLASGLHGIGKTTLATLVAAEAGVGFLETSGPLSIDQARDLFTACKDGDVVFIDEAHNLVTGGKRKGDWLLSFMLTGKLLGPNGAEEMPDVTIVAATTDVGALPETIISRFVCTPELTAYSDEEGALLVESHAARLGLEIDLTAEDRAAVARAADNNPRAIRKVLANVRDLAYAYPESAPNLDKAFVFSGVSADGLTVVAREILVLLLASPENTMGSETIKAQLGEPGPVAYHEKQLMQRGFIHITGRGRKLTDAGVARAVQALQEMQEAA